LFGRRQGAEPGQPFRLRVIEHPGSFGGEIEAQAARQNRLQNPLRFGGEQNQHGSGGRLFERFQKGVRCLRV
jgi:hypothetical protein